MVDTRGMSGAQETDAGIPEERIKYFDKKFDGIKDYSVSKEFMLEVKSFMKEQAEKITILESTVVMLQEHVSVLKNANTDLQIKFNLRMEESEQYSRRNRVRILGIPVDKEDETSHDVLEKVQDIIKKAGVVILDVAIDRAHRIGKRYTDENTGKTYQSVLAKFTTFRHSRLLYGARKSLDNIKIRLDLTKSRHKLLTDAITKVDKNKKVKFVYADQNCRLKLHPENGKDQFFNSLDELDVILLKL